MPWDITIELGDWPGTLASLGETAGGAGVNLEGVCGFPCEGVGVIHVAVDDAETAREAFSAAGITIRGEREVLVTDIADRPGAMGELTRRMTDGEINVDLIYLATGTRVVLGVDKLDEARKLL